MAVDPYETLGVSRSASPDEIRRAYRKLAKQHHPDLNPGNSAAEDRFKAANAANDLLSDPERRARFDRGEIDASGEPKYQSPPRYNDFAQGAGGFKYGAGPPFGEGPEGGGEYEDLFADFLHQAGARQGRRRPTGPRRGGDRSYSLDIGFVEAVNGGTQRLALPDGNSLDVRIPPGIDQGQVLRLRGKGDAGPNGGPPGDALIEVFIRPHPVFTREGNDSLVELPITLAEAVLGAKVAVPTTTGSVTLSIPPNSANGARLRLRGRGIPARAGPGRSPRSAGDQYVRLKLVLDSNDESLAAFLRARTDAPDFDPRREMEQAK
jgi:DnaJ-class molecular chaperone